MRKVIINVCYQGRERFPFAVGCWVKFGLYEDSIKWNPSDGNGAGEGDDLSSVKRNLSHNIYAGGHADWNGF